MTRNQTSQQASELYANFLSKKKKKKKKKICHSFQQVYCAQRGGKRCLLVSITSQKQSYPTYWSSVKIALQRDNLAENKISFYLKRRLSQINILFLNQQKRCIYINTKKIISSEIYTSPYAQYCGEEIFVCVNNFGVYVTFDGQWKCALMVMSHSQRPERSRWDLSCSLIDREILHEKDCCRS